MLPRTRFKKDIVCEFLSPSAMYSTSQKVIILCGGCPSVPEKGEVMEFWARKGFWVFFPRYRGTWESGGEFLKRSPHEDILDVIDELPKGFTDLWSGTQYRIVKPVVYILGASFGGAAAILCSRDPRVRKAVAFSPAIDWRMECRSVAEPMEKLGRYLPKGFGNAYRFSEKNWRRLMRGELYNPIDEIDTITPEKLLLFFARNDTVCDFPTARRFAARTGAKLVTFQTGGHFGLSDSILPRFYRLISKFLSPFKSDLNSV